jgi:vancomycin resistance protein YoaR
LRAKWVYSKIFRLILLSLIVSLMSIMISLFLYAYQIQMPKGMVISGWRVDSLDISQFQEAYERHLNQLYEKKVILFSSEPQVPTKIFTFAELGLTIDSIDIAEEINQLQNGSLFSRVKQRMKLSNSQTDLQFKMNQKLLRKTADEVYNQIEGLKPVPAQRIITPQDKVQYIEGSEGYSVDLSVWEKQLLRAAREQFVSVNLVQPQPYIEMKVPIVKTPPEMTVEKLKAQGVNRKIIQFSTSYANSGDGRSHNIEATAKVVHDRLLAPGEVFDYQKVIEQTRDEFGFKKAPVILNGKLVPGIGGGICQVSTTLYNAVLRSGLEIVERRNHSLAVSYVPLGQDATYSTGYINFKFKNTTDSHLLIRTSMENRRLTVKLFGTLPESVSYAVKSTIIETLEPPVKYLHNPNLAKGTEQSLRAGKPGYKVETYRIKKEHGKEVSREKISVDIYKAKPRLVARNKGGPSQQNTVKKDRIIEDGVDGPVYD